MTSTNNSITLSVIIVSYNTVELTIQTITSLLDDLKTSNLLGSTQIIVVDNNSSDDSVDKAQTLLQKVKTNHIIVKNKQNLGFGAANNKGIEESEGEFIWLLNSDTIVQPGATQALLNTFRNAPQDGTTAYLSSYDKPKDRLGIVASLLLNPDRTVQPQGGGFPSLISLFNHMSFLDDIPFLGTLLPSTQHTGLRQTEPGTTFFPQDWVGATSMMLRKETLVETGLFDKNIFMYAEDVELCMRAKAHHWDIGIQPKSEVIHIGSASSSSANALKGEFTGYTYIWSKHKPLWQRPLVKGILLFGALLRMIIFGTIKQDSNRAKVYREIWQELL